MVSIKRYFVHVCQVKSADAPRGGRLHKEKELFWDRLDGIIGKIPEEDLMIRGDLNEHVGMD